MSQDASGQISTVMQEERLFPPSAAFAKAAHIGSLEQYETLWKQAAEDSEGFWAKLAKEELHWFKPFTKTLDWKAPLAQWFVDGKTNVSFNCRFALFSTERRVKTAILWEGEPGDKRSLSYAELHEQVCKFANVLREKGIQPGDVVSIYMPMVPELAIAMLACARVGAVHSVIFGGFSSEAIADRNNDASAKMQITADGGWRRGKELPLKATVDEALKKSPSV
ncbi:MAG: AMP-binding protein, partial [Planctomycetota bacterium]|nr:AMP-binding protein [Planctomycetota bacterium]